jgi:hypothetical protein
MKETHHIQTCLFEQISKSLSSSVSLVDELSDVLGISIDSVYRRLKGETALNINEIGILCRKYNISLDSLFNLEGDTVTFYFHAMNDEKQYTKYMATIINDLKVLSKNKDAKIVYAGEDIPLFYNFRSAAFAKFKLFYWMKSIMNFEAFQGLQYNSRLVPDEIIDLGQELFDLYAKIPSIEIWTEITPISLFKQIEFFWESGIFQSKDDALAICDEVKNEFSLLEKQAETGRKFDSKGNAASNENSYLLYWSEIEIGNNCILTEIEGIKTVYLSFNTFNKISTRNDHFCSEIDLWLKNLIKKSNLISGISEKQRHRFFKRLNDSLELTRNKILA